MKFQETRKLKPGDKVYWKDPDGTCSRIYVIKYVEIDENKVIIEDVDGSVLECYPRELSRK